jgi:hypothetical protein
MNDAEEHHPLIVRLVRELGEYVVGDLSNDYSELALRRIEKTLLEIEQHSMSHFGVVNIDKDYDRWQDIHEDLGIPLETLTYQLGDAYVRVASSCARSRDLVSGTDVDKRITELEKRKGDVS